MKNSQAYRSFSDQFRQCNSDGTCQHMTAENYGRMPKKQQSYYRSTTKSMKFLDDYRGPRGPLFCGFKPGVCSSGHCPLRKRKVNSG